MDETMATVCMMMYVAFAATAVVVFEEKDYEEEEEDQKERKVMMAKGLQLMRQLSKRHDRLLEEEEADNPVAKKPKIKYDYERARSCVYQDYLGPDPLFERYFERVFRVSRSIAEQLIQVCGATHSFFTLKTNKVTGEQCMHPEVKVLMALKVLAYGVSPSAFMDYFQMSDTTGRKCLKDFCSIIGNHPLLRQKYLREASKSDAMNVSAMHAEEFGVRGCIGCLDCMHVYWKNCPSSWKGQYEGKEGCPSIVLEAVADYSTWIWHTRFGFPGTHNDINIWDQSSLLRMFLDGSFGDIDFPFRIANKTFNKVWLMTDGIYPELSRFVKTISVPTNPTHKMYSKWQEACRKSVERAFGILRRKFQILSRPMELLFEEDIRNVVNTCIILHNMMVELRVRREQQEDMAWYDEREYDNEDLEVPLLLSNVPPVAPTVPTVRQRIAAVNLQWPDETHNAERLTAIKAAIAEHFDIQRDEWSGLYNRSKHYYYHRTTTS
jgi:Plant transposon protein